MAFDQSTRNRLQCFVNDARKVLHDELTRHSGANLLGRLAAISWSLSKAGCHAPLMSISHWKVMIFFTIQLSGYSWIMRIIGRNNKNVEEATHWRA